MLLPSGYSTSPQGVGLPCTSLWFDQVSDGDWRSRSCTDFAEHGAVEAVTLPQYLAVATQPLGFCLSCHQSKAAFQLLHIHRQGHLRTCTHDSARCSMASMDFCQSRCRFPRRRPNLRYKLPKSLLDNPAVPRHLCASRGSISGIPTWQGGTLTYREFSLSRLPVRSCAFALFLSLVPILIPRSFPCHSLSCGYTIGR